MRLRSAIAAFRGGWLSSAAIGAAAALCCACEREEKSASGSAEVNRRRGEVMEKMERIAEEAAEARTHSVILISAGETPEQVRAALLEAGFAADDAETVIGRAPGEVKAGLTLAEAEALRDALIEAGARADLATAAPAE